VRDVVTACKPTEASTGNRAGTCSVAQASSAAAFGATPGASGNAVGSLAGRLSMTVSRVGKVVPRATECVHTPARAGVRPLETPDSGEAEFLGAAEHEFDDGLRIAGRVIANPELRSTVLGLDGEEERLGRRVLGGVLLHHAIVEIERARGVLRRADIEEAGEVREEVGHVRLLKRQSPARWPGCWGWVERRLG
jgi:hypothetical protein